jgi:hypothetical protein
MSRGASGKWLLQSTATMIQEEKEILRDRYLSLSLSLPPLPLALSLALSLSLSLCLSLSLSLYLMSVSVRSKGKISVQLSFLRSLFSADCNKSLFKNKDSTRFRILEI